MRVFVLCYCLLTIIGAFHTHTIREPWISCGTKNTIDVNTCGELYIINWRTTYIFTSVYATSTRWFHVMLARDSRHWYLTCPLLAVASVVFKKKKGILESPYANTYTRSTHTYTHTHIRYIIWYFSYLFYRKFKIHLNVRILRCRFKGHFYRLQRIFGLIFYCFVSCVVLQRLKYLLQYLSYRYRYRNAQSLINIIDICMIYKQLDHWLYITSMNHYIIFWIT